MYTKIIPRNPSKSEIKENNETVQENQVKSSNEKKNNLKIQDTEKKTQ